MLILIILLITLYAGFTQEINDLRKKRNSMTIISLYAIGMLLLWVFSNHWVLSGAPGLLVFISIIRALLTYYGKWKTGYERIDSYLSLVILFFMAFHVVVEFLRPT